MPGIYAIGDVAGEPMLAHKGSHEGLMAAAAIAGQEGAAYDPACVPAVVFTDPEVASVGLTAEEAKAAGFDPVEGKFPFAASGRDAHRLIIDVLADVLGTQVERSHLEACIETEHCVVARRIA